MDEVPDVRVEPPWQRIARVIGPPHSYRLTRWLILRLLGVVYVAAFAGIWAQAVPLLGEHGLTPIATYVADKHAHGIGFIDLPTVFHASTSDTMIRTCAAIGLVLAIACAIGYANLPSLLVLWLLYGSFERVGQLWFGFGWEIQLLETGFLAAFLAHPWDPRPLAARAPTTTAIALFRWLAFRIYLGAGLIKLRGAACWTELTCLDGHFETQPIPNVLSPLFHHLPHAVHAVGVIANHVVENVAPWLIFAPRVLRLIAGCAMAAFQITLIASGNLAFLNWLTLVPILACLDDEFLLRLAPRRVRAWLVRMLASGGAIAGWTQRAVCYVLAILIALESRAVIRNLASDEQAMNHNYDRLALVNTYGAFGSVDMVRHEIVIEGTLDADPEHATWQAYELPCKPGALDRRPCVLGPYHLRLDWLIWFAAMRDEPRDPWILHLVWKLLDGDRSVRELIAVDPFDGRAPAWVRIRRFVYHLEPYASAAWWSRDHEELWLQPVSLATPGLRDALARYGWPSPSLR